MAGAYVPIELTDKACKDLHDKWKACAAMCKKFKLERKRSPQRSNRGRASSKADHKSFRARSPSPNPDSIQPPTFPNRGRGISLMPPGGAADPPAEPLFAEMHFGEERGFAGATCVCLYCTNERRSPWQCLCVWSISTYAPLLSQGRGRRRGETAHVAGAVLG